MSHGASYTHLLSPLPSLTPFRSEHAARRAVRVLERLAEKVGAAIGYLAHQPRSAEVEEVQRALEAKRAEILTHGQKLMAMIERQGFIVYSPRFRWTSADSLRLQNLD